jgi:hypothetical protein
MNYKKLAMGLLILLLAASTLGASAAGTGAGYLPRQPGPDLADDLLDWQQANSDGFGDPGELELSALEAFNGYLYAGTYNPIDPALLYDGARIYRSPDGVAWSPVTLPGFGNSHDIAPPAILDFVVFNNGVSTALYAGTGRGNAVQIWRSLDGSIWAPMMVTGFSDPDNVDINALAVYDGMIYAGVTNAASGAKIYRSYTGDSNSWNQVTSPASTIAGAGVTGFAEFDGGLWATVESEDPVQIWRTYGGDWEVMRSDGFGNADTTLTGGMAVFGAYLYVGVGNTGTGPQLWRTDGTNWSQVTPAGFTSPNNQQIEMLSVFQNHLYASLKNTVTGIEVWRTPDSSTWEQVNVDGFGDSHNTGTNRGNASDNFLNQFYLGISNVVSGAELWRTIIASPTDILLTDNTVDENQPVNTIVGGLSATSPDPAAIFAFSLACALPGVDDASFNILGTNLRTSAVFDRETKFTHNICIRVADQAGRTYDKNFVITVNNLNEPPTNISLSNNAVDENQPLNTLVGVLTAADPDASASFTYSLACAIPGANDASFNILAASLRTSVIFDFETKSTYNICIRVTDQGELTYDKNFVITISNISQEVPPTYLPIIFR